MFNSLKNDKLITSNILCVFSIVEDFSFDLNDKIISDVYKMEINGDERIIIASNLKNIGKEILCNLLSSLKKFTVRHLTLFVEPGNELSPYFFHPEFSPLFSYSLTDEMYKGDDLENEEEKNYTDKLYEITNIVGKNVLIMHTLNFIKLLNEIIEIN